MIPKIIHYCWFGNNEMPQTLIDCIETWRRYLPDYEIKRWDNSTCSFDENEFVRRAYSEKRWAHVSDYYRLKALYNEGGIYLDTDVRLRKSLTPLLDNKCFFNFIYDCVIGGGTIGAVPKDNFIGELLMLYEGASFGQTTNGMKVQFVDDKLILRDFDTNNFIFTYYVLKKYPSFRLNNRYQNMGDFVIYPKELFEVGSLLYNHYSIHLGIGSWKTRQKTDIQKNRERQHSFAFEYVRIIVRKYRYYKQNKKIFFYKFQIAQKKNGRLVIH